jgi:hypothetical protein
MIPSSFSRLLGDGAALGFPDALGAGFTALASQRDGGRILALLGARFLDLASSDPHHVDGIADDIGWALVAFRSWWHA